MCDVKLDWDRCIPKWDAGYCYIASFDTLILGEGDLAGDDVRVIG